MSLISLFKNNKKSEKAESPLFNLRIELKGWKDPFKDLKEFEFIADREKVYRNYSGNFYVSEGGKLIKGYKEGFHIFNGTINLQESDLHVHHDFGIGVSDILNRDRNLFLSHIFLNKPIYTLQGLYGSLPNKKINTQINALKGSLESLTNYKFNSIATRKETKLKLLENAYSRYISDQ